MPSILLLAALIHGLFTGTSHAYKEFTTHCEIPNSTVNFVTSPDTRGSVDIAWSCWGTLVACTFTVLHMNVPDRSTPQAKSMRWVEKFIPFWWYDLSSYFRSEPYANLHRCLMSIIAPEFCYGAYIGEFLDAWAQRDKMRDMLQEHGVPWIEAKKWTMTHMFYANMGGFVLRYRRDDGKTKKKREPAAGSPNRNNQPTGADARRDEKALAPDESRTSKEFPATDNAISQEESETSAVSHEITDTSLAHADKREPPSLQFVSNDPSSGVITNASPDIEKGNRRGSLIGVGDDEQIHYDRYYLNAAVLRTAIKHGYLSARAIPVDVINDRSKLDWFARLITVLQLVDFFTNVIARAIEGLPISPAEVAVAAFAVCSVVAYAIIFCKPKDVATPIILHTYEEYEVPRAIQGYKARYNKNKQELDSDSPLEEKDYKKVSRPAAFGEFRLRPGQEGFMLATGALIGTIFGAVHLSAWNLEFPSKADMWLWRSSSIATTVIPGVYALMAVFAVFIPEPMDKSEQTQPTPQKAFRDQPWYLQILIALGFCIAVSGAAAIMIAYFGGRGILLVEMIRTLFYLPPRTYLTPSWSIDIPHIS